MNVFQLIVGAVLVYIGFYGHNAYSPVLFVEGMILLNLALFIMFAGGRRRH